MAGPSITWQTAAQSVESATGVSLPAWHDVLQPTPLEAFTAWIEADLLRLEHQYSDFTTPNSIARDSAFGRISHP